MSLTETSKEGLYMYFIIVKQIKEDKISLLSVSGVMFLHYRAITAWPSDFAVSWRNVRKKKVYR